MQLSRLHVVFTGIDYELTNESASLPSPYWRAQAAIGEQPQESEGKSLHVPFSGALVQITSTNHQNNAVSAADMFVLISECACSWRKWEVVLSLLTLISAS